MTKPNRKHGGLAGYHSFKDESGQRYGSFEVFWVNEYELEPEDGEHDGSDYIEAGWYWAAGFPGCLWDGEPSGPFNSSRAAYLDAIDD